MDRLPDNATAPISWSIFTVLALVTSHWRVAEPPAARLDGVASKLVMAGAAWLEVLEDVDVGGGADTVTQPAAKAKIATKNSNAFSIYPS
jgi:hypothetical protein